MAIILISLVPGIVEYLRHRKNKEPEDNKPAQGA